MSEIKTPVPEQRELPHYVRYRSLTGIATSSPSSWRAKPLLVRVAVAGSIVAIFYGVRIGLFGVADTQFAYLTFFPAVAAAGLVGGLGGGAFATVLSALLAFFWIDTPDEISDWIGLGLFLFGASLILGSAELLSRAKSEQRMLDTLESITNAFFAVDREFRVTLVNQASERIVGLSREDLLGRLLWDCIPVARDTGFQRRCELVMKTGEAIACEELYAPLKRWFDVKICPAREGIAVFFQDITERKRADAALRESEERLRLALRAGKIGTWEWNAVTGRTTWDARACEIYGHDPNTPINREIFLDRVHPEDRGMIKDAIETAMRTLGDYQCEYRITRDDGAVRWVSSRGTPSVDHEGSTSRIIGVNFDVTERKSRERNLDFWVSLQKAFAAADTSEDIMRVSARMIAGHLNLVRCAFMSINESAEQCKVVWDHHSPGAPSIAGEHRIMDFHTEEDRRALRAGKTMVVDNVFSDPRTAENSVRFASLKIGSLVNAGYVSSGSWKFVLHASRALPFAWASEDIDLLAELAARIFVRLERATAEAALRESERRLDLALSGGDLGVWDWNIVTNEVQFDARWAQMIGYTTDEVHEGFAFWETRVHPDDLPTVLEALEAHLSGRSPTYRVEHRVRHKLGEWVWILTSGRVFETNAQGEPTRAVGVHVDISEQKRTQQVLHERERLLKAATDNASVGLVSLDTERRYNFVNPAYCSIFGLTSAEISGRLIAEVLGEAYDGEVASHLDRAYAGERVFHTIKRPAAQGPLGRYNHFTAVYEPERDGDGKVTGVVIVIFDITDRKRAEDRHLLLIRELDHRVKNVLARMAVVIERSREGAHSIDEFLNAIDGRIHSMAKTHSRLSRNQWTGVSLAALVGDELDPYRTSTNTLVSGPDVELGPDAAQVVSMVLHELATNAAKYGALSGTKGRVSVVWALQTEPTGDVIALTWEETGTRAVSSPQRESYGTEVIRELVRYELGGTAMLDFAHEGIVARFLIPSGRAMERRA